MNEGVAITGMGINSAIGMNQAENFQALLSRKHGLSRVENFATHLKDKVFVGEIKQTNDELAATLQLPALNDFSRTDMLGALAIQEALKSASLNMADTQSMGFINATTVGGMDIQERYFFEFLERNGHRNYLNIYDTGANTHQIADYFGIKGFVTTISTACSSAANAIMLGARMIRNGQLDKVIVGGTDALCKFTMNGFNSLMILSPEFNQPFDEERKGLNLGEGAAYLILESKASYEQRGMKPLAFINGYANANDAHHQTASSETGEGAYLAMKNALKVAGINPEAVDYINVHGTATENNDLSEGKALERIFGDTIPDFSSTKPFTGHTLAAAGAIEAVFSILALQHNVAYPNLNFNYQMKAFPFTPLLEEKRKNLAVILSNSFGFGGNCSSLIFSQSER